METSSDKQFLNHLAFYFVLFVILFSLVYFAYSKFQNGLGSTPQAESTLASLPAERQLELIKASSSFVIPGIAGHETLEVSDLPPYVQSLFANMDGEFESVLKLSFEDGATGYSVNFVALTNTVEELYFLFQRNSGTPWPPVSGSRTGDAAFLTIDHSEYLINAEFLKNLAGAKISTVFINK